MLTGRRRAGRRAAVAGYARAGWAIAPGAWWDPGSGRYRCRTTSCLTTGSLHPAEPELEPTLNERVWSGDPATVLLVTGHGVDVVDLPLDQRADPAAAAAAAWARGLHHGPVALWESTRDSTRPSNGPRLLLAARSASVHKVDLRTRRVGDRNPQGRPRPGEPGGLPAGALVHGSGSYVPLPPSRLRGGGLRWLHPPQATGWALPDLDVLLDLLTAAAHAGSALTPVTGAASTRGPETTMSSPAPILMPSPLSGPVPVGARPAARHSTAPAGASGPARAGRPGRAGAGRGTAVPAIEPSVKYRV